MYCYLYDNLLKGEKYQKTIASLETSLAELGVNGKGIYLNILKNPQEIVSDEIKHGCETIIVVGSELLLNQVINVVASADKVALGFIPLGEASEIGEFFGLPEGLDCCPVIANRIISRVDLGRVNNYYFLGHLEILSQAVEVECDGRFRVRFPNEGGKFYIYNAGFLVGQKQEVFQPDDGRLQVVIPRAKAGWFASKAKPTIFSAHKVSLKSLGETIATRLDDRTVVNLPLQVTIAKKKLKLIVGKERKY